ncbi:hypothetical protein [Hyalangium minutum]|uniref:Uncharacterized protein n=1 Tax=Hyalangium minutum TaxID=394096 RepID=A0A085W8J7_9BACT|nr:hypothetical protein [Hyalangium minutum]KFE64010.1 hypothetical protein DB31_2422 [Hyalangium minutum]
MKSSEDWSRLGGILIALMAFVMVALAGPRLLGMAAGPEAEIIAVLKGLEKRGVSLSLPGVPAPLTSKDLHYERITVRVEPGGQRAEVLATLDFTGALGETNVSSLGVEQVFFVLRDGDWVPETLAAPRLAAVVRALEARRRALDQGDAAALAQLWGPGEEDGGGGSVGVGEPELDTVLALKQRRYRAEAWFLRLEREDAVATEHWRLQGDLPSRPVDQQGERHLNLLRRGEEFLFSAAVR